jgi:predicted nucleotidyltransferase
MGVRGEKPKCGAYAKLIGMRPDGNSSGVELPRRAVAEFCRRRKITELALFGSMLRGDCGPDSDVDVLVRFDFGVHPSLTELDEMSRELAGIFGRKVDLVERAAIESSANYIRRRHILESAEPVYVAR